MYRLFYVTFDQPNEDEDESAVFSDKRWDCRNS